MHEKNILKDSLSPFLFFYRLIIDSNVGVRKWWRLYYWNHFYSVTDYAVIRVIYFRKAVIFLVSFVNVVNCLVALVDARLDSLVILLFIPTPPFFFTLLLSFVFFISVSFQHSFMTWLIVPSLFLHNLNLPLAWFFIELLRMALKICHRFPSLCLNDQIKFPDLDWLISLNLDYM